MLLLEMIRRGAGRGIAKKTPIEMKSIDNKWMNEWMAIVSLLELLYKAQSIV